MTSPAQSYKPTHGGRVDAHTFHACRCRYQDEHPWGYSLYRWIGGRKSWKPLGHGDMLTVKKHAEKEPRILVMCRGCGNDIVREYVNRQNQEAPQP